MGPRYMAVTREGHLELRQGPVPPDGVMREYGVPKIHWVPGQPEDILSALEATPRAYPHYRAIDEKGDTYRTQLTWARAALQEAEAAGATDRGRQTGQAVTHAKRSLDALFDAFLERDYLDIHLRPRAQFSAKVQLLKSRLP